MLTVVAFIFGCVLIVLSSLHWDELSAMGLKIVTGVVVVIVVLVLFWW